MVGLDLGLQGAVGSRCVVISETLQGRTQIEAEDDGVFR